MKKFWQERPASVDDKLKRLRTEKDGATETDKRPEGSLIGNLPNIRAAHRVRGFILNGGNLALRRRIEPLFWPGEARPEPLDERILRSYEPTKVGPLRSSWDVYRG
jgi:hypothetical protein